MQCSPQKFVSDKLGYEVTTNGPDGLEFLLVPRQMSLIMYLVPTPCSTTF